VGRLASDLISSTQRRSIAKAGAAGLLLIPIFYLLECKRMPPASYPKAACGRVDDRATIRSKSSPLLPRDKCEPPPALATSIRPWTRLPPSRAAPSTVSNPSPHEQILQAFAAQQPVCALRPVVDPARHLQACERGGRESPPPQGNRYQSQRSSSISPSKSSSRAIGCKGPPTLAGLRLRSVVFLKMKRWW
jgi:hypothetical protein